MLVCFGCSWPMSVYKHVKAHSAKAMSLPFILLIITGYIAGIGAKLYTHTINYVLAVYLLNLIIVSVDLAVYFINRKYDIESVSEIEKGENKMLKQNRKEQVITDKAMLAKIKSYSEMNNFAKRGGTVFFGSDYFSKMPVNELAQDLESDCTLYNRSIDKLTVRFAQHAYDETVKSLSPDTVFINLGDEDVLAADFNIDSFIESYQWLLYNIHGGSTTIYIVSVIADSPKAAVLNERLRMLAKDTGCEFIDAQSILQSEYPMENLFSTLCSRIIKQPMSFAKAMSM